MVGWGIAAAAAAAAAGGEERRGIESESERTRVSLAKVLVAVQERHSPEESGSEELHKTMQDARTYAHTM